MNEDKETYMIQLLNEFLDDWQEWSYACYPLDEDTFDRFFHTKDWQWTIEEAQVISKKLWFIGRLCDNFRIDEEKLERENSMYVELSKDYKLEDVMLMLLSIQFRPLKFLSNYLK